MPSIFSRAVTTFSSLSLLLHPMCTTEAGSVHRESRELAERELILGGTEVTDKNQYPYMAYIHSTSYGHPKKVRVCGATLVAKNILLTSASCSDGDPITAQIGRLGTDVEEVKITGKKIHPHFDKWNEELGIPRVLPKYDYMLLKLEKDIKNVPRVRLDDGTDEKLTQVGREVVTMGYGVNIDAYNSNDKLHAVDLKMLAHTDCEEKHRGLGLSDGMICTSGDDYKDACMSDGGGPLIDKETGIQTGIVSSTGCANTNAPSVYASVSKEFKWIREEIGKWKAMCMAGSTRVKTPEGFVRVDDLEIGMQIMGVTAEGVQDPNCNVVAIGSNDNGIVYGNYTSGHFVLQEDGETVAEHGEIGELRTDRLFDVLLDCPFGIDEVGTKFSAMANYYSAAKEDTTSVDIGHHLIVYEVLLYLVRKTGTFWMSSKSYNNITDAKIKQGEIINLMIECLHSNADKRPCARLEEASRVFVEEQFPTGAMRRRALSGTNNITSVEGHDDGEVEEVTFGDIIHNAFPKLGSPDGENGTVVFALREEVQKSRTPMTAIVLSTVAAVAGVAFIVTVMIVRRNRRRNDGTSREHPETSIE